MKKKKPTAVARGQAEPPHRGAALSMVDCGVRIRLKKSFSFPHYCYQKPASCESGIPNPGKRESLLHNLQSATSHFTNWPMFADGLASRDPGARRKRCRGIFETGYSGRRRFFFRLNELRKSRLLGFDLFPNFFFVLLRGFALGRQTLAVQYHLDLLGVQ